MGKEGLGQGFLGDDALLMRYQEQADHCAFSSVHPCNATCKLCLCKHSHSSVLCLFHWVMESANVIQIWPKLLQLCSSFETKLPLPIVPYMHWAWSLYFKTETKFSAANQQTERISFLMASLFFYLFLLLTKKTNSSCDIMLPMKP